MFSSSSIESSIHPVPRYSGRDYRVPHSVLGAVSTEDTILYSHILGGRER